MAEFLWSIYIYIPLWCFSTLSKEQCTTPGMGTRRAIYVLTCYSKKNHRETWGVCYLSSHLEMIFWSYPVGYRRSWKFLHKWSKYYLFPVTKLLQLSVDEMGVNCMWKGGKNAKVEREDIELKWSHSCKCLSGSSENCCFASILQVAGGLC